MKLVIVDVCEECSPARELRYFIDEGHLREWNYAPAASGRKIITCFE